MDLIARCEQSRVLNAQLHGVIASTLVRCPRESLVLAAMSLAHEHHSAISKLLMTSHFGSAATLLRPQVEASITAAWALYAASEQQITDLIMERQHLPKPVTMMRKLDARPELKGNLDLRTFYEGPGTILHKFTHGDMIQLQRRFGSGFRDEEKFGTVLLADFFMLMGSTVFAVVAKTAEFEEFLKVRTDQLVEELRTASGQPIAEWSGWEPLPPSAFPPMAVSLDLQERMEPHPAN